MAQDAQIARQHRILDAIERILNLDPATETDYLLIGVEFNVTTQEIRDKIFELKL